MVHLRVLGPAQLVGPDGKDFDALTRQPKRMALLAYLAIAFPGGLHRRDKLLAIFWPELDDPHARNALSQALHVLRTALGAEALITRGDNEVGIAPDALRADVSHFEAALDSGRPRDAFRLYKGDLLDGFFLSGVPEFERWLDGERSRLRQRASDCGWTLARMSAEHGDVVEAQRYARWAANQSLSDETQLRQLMNFLHGLGDRSAAVHAYEDFARRFAEEYELQPSPETEALATAIRSDVHVNPIRSQGVSKTDASLVSPEPPASRPEESPLEATLQTPRRWGRRVLALGLLVTLAGITASFALRTRVPQAPKAAHQIPRLVVLPLQNLGAPENAYFAQGIGDEISTRLTTIRGLSVIGGSAAQRYRTAQSAGRLATAGNPVDYFLEGSASWLPSEQGRGHVRVRLRLVNAHDDTELWGAVLNEDIAAMTELLALYSRIAQRVVDELDMVLEAPRLGPMSAIPTTNLEAYNDYLRGRDYMTRTSTPVNFSAAIQTLQRAVTRDTSFALAFALLGNAHAQAVWLGGSGREHLDSAKADAERALRLDPNLPDGHTYLGFYYYACCEDYERAMWHLTKSNAMRPGDYQVVMFMGNVHKRQGRWAESIKHYEEAVRLDPLARWPQNNLGHAQMWARRYDDAERTFRGVLASEPQDIFAYAHLAWLIVLRDGDAKTAWRIIDEARRSAEGFPEMRIPYYLALLDRNYDAALASLTAPEPGLTASLLNEWLVDDEIRRALVLRLRGDSASARAEFDSARAELEMALKAVPRESHRSQLWLRSGLAIAYAGLDQRRESMAQINVVLASNPLKVDAIEGPKYLQHVALAQMLLGNREAAIDVLEQLLSVGAPVSRQSLRLEPFWDPLRSHPRFARMIAGNK